MRIRILLYALLFVACSYLASISGVSFPFSKLKDYLDILSDVSGMVFTIMGIWIAFIYPNALSRLVDPDKIKTADFSESLGETRRLEAIVASIMMSAFVLTSVMFILLGRFIFGGAEFFIDNSTTVKANVTSFVLVLTAMQVEAVAQVMYSNLMFINDLHSKRESREMDADL